MAEKEGEDESTQNLWKFYKRKVDINGVTINKLFKEKVEFANSEGVHLTEIKLWDNIGPVGVRAIFEAFIEKNME